jgi:adenylate kinase family enzyme
MGGTLLILGAPGAGKTTLLLELARDLIAHAEQDEVYPVPCGVQSFVVGREATTVEGPRSAPGSERR